MTLLFTQAVKRGTCNFVARLYASEEGQWSVSRRCQAKRVILVAIQDHKERYTMEQIQVVPCIWRGI